MLCNIAIPIDLFYEPIILAESLEKSLLKHSSIGFRFQLRGSGRHLP